MATTLTPINIERFSNAEDPLGNINAAGVVSLRPLSGLLSTIDVAFPLPVPRCS
jgi:hypothetical protein